MRHFSLALDETITAVATPEGGGCEGILRLSGPESWASVAGRLVSSPAALPKSRPEQPWAGTAALRIWDDAAPVSCTVYFWPKGSGYTAQEAVELHLPGCDSLLQTVLTQLLSSGQVRLAEPGEFTLRAFLAGRLDLTQAEAVLGVIDAENRQALQTALSQLAGGIAFPLKVLRESLLEMLAHLEAGIDFAEEGIRFVESGVLTQFLLESRDRINRLRERLARRSTTETLPSVVILGATNAGKSRLFNALISGPPTSRTEEAAAMLFHALVSDIPGTTRDYLEIEQNWEGARFRLIDTAGLGKQFETPPDQQAQEFARKLSDEADLRLFCLPADREILEPWEKRFLQEQRERLLVVRTKTDVLAFDGNAHNLLYGTGLEDFFAATTHTADTSDHPLETLGTSALTGQGLAELRRRVVSLLSGPNKLSEVIPTTALRCQSSLDRAWEALTGALNLLGLDTENAFSGKYELSNDVAISCDYDESLVAAELRLALDALGEVVGTVYTDDILDRIFSRFCIGK